MKWSNVKWIFLREVRDQLRDRRTMFTIAVLPLVLYPLLGMGFLQVAQFAREHTTRVLILGAAALPESPKLLDGDAFVAEYCPPREARLLELEIQEDALPGPSVRESAEAAIQAGHVAAVVRFPEDFGQRLAEFQKSLLERAADDGGRVRQLANSVPEPEIFVSTASDKSRIASDRVERVLRRWRDTIVADNLRSSQLPAEATSPFEFVSKDVARERSRRAAVWSKILPFIVLIWALTGAFYPAVDLCAGEKERGTLETLLCSPAGRNEIVWGKLLTIMSFSMATSLLNLCSMGFTGTFVVHQIRSLDPTNTGLGAPPLAAIAWILLSLIPLSALFSALSLAVAAFARSSKEGQYYLMPLLIITLPLMMLPLLPTAELDLGTSLIPVTGMMLLLRALIEGQFLEALRFVLPVLAVTSVCCLLAVRWAIDQFNNESVLFRESERWSVRLWLRQMVRDRHDTPTISEAVFCGILLLMIRFFASFAVGTPTSWSAFSASTVVSLLAFIAAPALLMTVVLTRSPRKTLLLRWPGPASLGVAALLAISVHPLGIALAEGVRTLYPFTADIEQQLGTVNQLLLDAPGILALLTALALAPTICEELAFRGFILSGLRHMGHRWAAIVVSSLFFGAAHGILQQSLTAFAVGIVIGYIAVQTGSLLPGIVFHLIYNSLSLLMATQVPALMSATVKTPIHQVLDWLFTTDGGIAYRLPVVGLSLVLSALAINWFRRLPYEASPEEALQDALDHQLAVSNLRS